MKIFLSYSWKDKDLADDIDKKFESIGISLLRDVRDIGYTQSIKEYMKKIRKSDFAMVIISDDYLKSINCMYEMLEFIKDESYKKRILPIIKTNACIFDSNDRISYIKYWENRFEELNLK